VVCTPGGDGGDASVLCDADAPADVGVHGRVRGAGGRVLRAVAGRGCGTHAAHAARPPATAAAAARRALRRVSTLLIIHTACYVYLRRAAEGSLQGSRGRGTHGHHRISRTDVLLG
jgi:hypothetical protein